MGEYLRRDVLTAGRAKDRSIFSAALAGIETADVPTDYVYIGYDAGEKNDWHAGGCAALNATTYIAALEMNPAAIATLARAMPADGVRWRPEPDDWSALEVINHLADEEREDFRTRLAFVLDPRGETPPPNHPAAWVIERGYNGRDFDESLARFVGERRQSLAWLRGLATPDWSRAWESSAGYALRAGDLLASWAAHDLLHLRQLVALQYLYRAQQAAPYRVAYAGDW